MTTINKCYTKLNPLYISNSTSTTNANDLNSLAIEILKRIYIPQSRAMSRSTTWQSLPEELAERVFAQMQISTVLASRCVCRQWRNILTSNSFVRLWGELSEANKDTNKWFLVYHSPEVIAAYDPTSSKWTNIPVYRRCGLDHRQVLLMASAGGLLCYRDRHAESPVLIVCNPLTEAKRVLPEMSHVRYIDILGMVEDKATNSYKILVTGTTESATDESITEVYDSLSGKWTYHCSSQQEFLQFWYQVHALWMEGSFYCLAMPVAATQGYRLLKYDMERKSWSDLDVRMPSNDLRCPSLLICQGKRILLVGKIVEDHLIKSIVIWELKRDGLGWIKVDTMPPDVLGKIHLPYFLILQCQGNNNLICFSTHRGWQSLIYDIPERTWQLLPQNHVNVQGLFPRNGRSNLVGLPYEPRLTAQV